MDWGIVFSLFITSDHRRSSIKSEWAAAVQVISKSARSQQQQLLA